MVPPHLKICSTPSKKLSCIANYFKYLQQTTSIVFATVSAKLQLWIKHHKFAYFAMLFILPLTLTINIAGQRKNK